MPVSNKLKQVRDEEILRLASSMARQFGVTDPLEIQEVTEAVQLSFDTTGPLLKYSPSTMADSGKFRNDTRNALINIIAFLIQIEEIERGRTELESNSRKSLDSNETQVKLLEDSYIQTDRDLLQIESFSIRKARGSYQGVQVDGGVLKIISHDDAAARRVKGIEAAIYPTAASNQFIVHETVGDINSVLNTEPGSGIWGVNVYTPAQELTTYWSQPLSRSSMSEGAMRAYHGILIDLTLKLKDPIDVNYLGAKFLTPSKLIRVYTYSGQGSDDTPSWQPAVDAGNRFVQSEGYEYDMELYNFGEVSGVTDVRMVFNVARPEDTVPQLYLLEKMYTRGEVFRGIATDDLNFEEYIRMEDNFLYHFGLHNIKVRNRKLGAITSQPAPTPSLKKYPRMI